MTGAVRITVEFSDGQARTLEGEEANRWLTAASDLSLANEKALVSKWKKTARPQARIASWVRLVFNEATATNAPERTLRFVEEAVELAQAVGIDAGTVHRLVDYVFSRPVGSPPQEVAGSMVTLYAAAVALNIDADAEFEREYERIQRPEVIERVRRRQAEKRAATVTADSPEALKKGTAHEK